MLGNEMGRVNLTGVYIKVVSRYGLEDDFKLPLNYQCRFRFRDR